MDQVESESILARNNRNQTSAGKIQGGNKMPEEELSTRDPEMIMRSHVRKYIRLADNKHEQINNLTRSITVISDYGANFMANLSLAAGGVEHFDFVAKPMDLEASLVLHFDKTSNRNASEVFFKQLQYHALYRIGEIVGATHSELWIMRRRMQHACKRWSTWDKSKLKAAANKANHVLLLQMARDLDFRLIDFDTMMSDFKIRSLAALQKSNGIQTLRDQRSDITGDGGEPQASTEFLTNELQAFFKKEPKYEDRKSFVHAGTRFVDHIVRSNLSEYLAYAADFEQCLGANTTDTSRADGHKSVTYDGEVPILKSFTHDVMELKFVKTEPSNLVRDSDQLKAVLEDKSVTMQWVQGLPARTFETVLEAYMHIRDKWSSKKKPRYGTSVAEEMKMVLELLDMNHGWTQLPKDDFLQVLEESFIVGAKVSESDRQESRIEFTDKLSEDVEAPIFKDDVDSYVEMYEDNGTDFGREYSCHDDSSGDEVNGGDEHDKKANASSSEEDEIADSDEDEEEDDDQDDDQDEEDEEEEDEENEEDEEDVKRRQRRSSRYEKDSSSEGEEDQNQSPPRTGAQFVSTTNSDIEGSLGVKGRIDYL